MKVAPIRYDVCIECSLENIELKNYTVQYLREIQFPKSRSSWGRHRPILTYICSECGRENYD